MAKRNANPTQGPQLFESHSRITARRIRRQRALFIPRFLTDEAGRANLAGLDQDAAHAIILRWADHESAGHLPRHKETSIDAQFLDQVFGEGLGYAIKTVSPTAYHLEHKFSVPGVGIADAAIGEFPGAKSPTVVIELKDARTDLDRDRSNGRTAVQQCWDYLNALPDCPWGIVSNFSTIRLYHRDKGSLAYEEFTLQEMRDRKRFNEFYHLFERGGLLPSKARQQPRALALLDLTQKRQKTVGDELYKFYQSQRLHLIDHLMKQERYSLDEAIAIAQKLLDRVIFIAFCEDRDLLPENTLRRTHEGVPHITRVTNPRWKNFLALFDAVDKGANGRNLITAFNGGLFASDRAVDSLELEDEPWTDGFRGFGNFDFSEEVNVEVLGHIFERSVTELEKLRVGGLFALKTAVENGSANDAPANGRTKRKRAAPRQPDPQTSSKMPKSAQRKRFGIYYTPPAFTGLIVERTLDAIVKERFAAIADRHCVDPDARDAQDQDRLREYWRACFETLQRITICDPACGSGAFLIRAYDALDAHYKAVTHGLGGAGLEPEELVKIEDVVPDLILTHNLFGVDLSREAVEITQLALWIRSARRGKSLADLSRNIIHGNSLIADPDVDPHALNWQAAFPAIFPSGGEAGFTCVIGNPPWERIKVQEREFFSFLDPATAQAVSAADRRKRIAAMPQNNPELHDKYLAAQERAQKTLEYARVSGRFPLTGKGDVNLYMLFAELARTIVAPDGLVGLLVPSGIATDDTTKKFFNAIMDGQSLVSLYDFENRSKHFEDVHRSFKFSAIVFGGAARRTEQADFVFFARDVEEVVESNRKRHIPLTAGDMALLNPNTKTCPIFRTQRDANLTRAIYRRIPILIDAGRRQGGNPWGIRFLRMFDQTNDAEHFKPRENWTRRGFPLQGNTFIRGEARALPLYEAKMVQAFDHRAASVLVEKGNWVRQGQKVETTPVQHANPEFAVMPRWWVGEEAVNKALEGLPGDKPWFMGFKDITSPTNERTMIASFIPRSAVTNKFVLMLTDLDPRLQSCLLANLNAFVFDYVTRQKIGGITLNFFIVEQLPTLPPDRYADACPWSRRQTLEAWISERVLKLSCTAEDMIPLAQACGFSGSSGDGVHIWNDSERGALRAELDAAYFHLYGIEREDVEYILSTFTGAGRRDDDAQARGEPKWDRKSTGAMILDAYDALAIQH